MRAISDHVGLPVKGLAGAMGGLIAQGWCNANQPCINLCMRGVWAAAAVMMVWGLAVGVVMWGSGVDMWLTQALWARYDHGMNVLMRVLGEVGKGSFQAGVCAVVCGGVWGWGKNSRPWVWCVPVFLVAGAVGVVLKVLVGRARPKEVLWNGVGPYEVHPGTWDAGFWSFPSGHAVSTFAIATVLAAAYPAQRWVIWPVAAVLAASRFLALTPHYMGDVVAGAAVGSAVAVVCVAVLRRRAWL